MTEDPLIVIIAQLQSEVETLGIRGVSVASQEQINWFRHTSDRVSEMGAEFLAQKMSALLACIEGQEGNGAARLLDLLTTIRVFDRVLTLQTAAAGLQHVAEFESQQVGDSA